LPNFTHVYLYPPTVAVVPALEQTAPAFTAACTGAAVKSPTELAIKALVISRLIYLDFARPKILNRARAPTLPQLCP
jgi:hypothetical protein